MPYGIDGTIKIWKTSTNDVAKIITAVNISANDIYLDKNEEYLSVANGDFTVSVFDFFKIIQKIEESDKQVEK